jgi:4-aminobutyrate aminotransferase-like enzyme
VNYAQRLSSTMPCPSLEVVFVVNSGSEANDLALRLARTYTKSNDIICLDAAYHGHTAALIEISPYKYEGKGGFPKVSHVSKVELPCMYRGPSRDPASAGLFYADKVLDCVKEIQSKGRRPAAFIAESVLGCGGQIVLPDNFLKESYKHVRSAGGLCIADEVQVGFGRVGSHFWAFETQGVVPDIVTCGKPAGNGFPLACVITTRAIADAFSNGTALAHTHTLSFPIFHRLSHWCY